MLLISDSDHLTLSSKSVSKFMSAHVAVSSMSMIMFVSVTLLLLPSCHMASVLPATDHQ